MKNTAPNILDLRKKLDNNEVTKEELIIEFLNLANKYQNTYNPFVTILNDTKQIVDNKNSLLNGIPYAIKDNLSTKDILSTGSSNTLKDYVPFFDATVVKKLKASGAINIGKTVMDELGMGGTGTTSNTGIVKNPYDKTRISGGSSAGSAVSVALGIVPFSLGSDTGDSIRKPAAYCGIVGYKPTYGLVSRYGLFPFACSLDHVGCFTRNVKDAAIVIDTIKGKDENDMTTLKDTDESLYEKIDGKVNGRKLFYIKEIANIESYTNPSKELTETLNIFKDTVSKLNDIGIEVDEISIDKTLLNAILPTYLCISCAEATSNYSNLTGIIFGPRGRGKSIEEIMLDHRTNGFCTLIKRRFIIGSYVLQKENQEKYFLNASRVRRLIVDKMNELFKIYDGLILPCGEIAPLIEKEKEVISEDEDRELAVLENHMAIGNFGGFPSITIPNGFVDNLPIGVNITGKVLDDANILNIAYALEETLDFKNMISKGEC